MLTTVGNRFRRPGEGSADGPTGIIGRAVTARDEEAEQTDGRPVTRPKGVQGGSLADAGVHAPGGQARAGSPGAADVLARAARAVRRGLAVTVAPQSTREAADALEFQECRRRAIGAAPPKVPPDPAHLM